MSELPDLHRQALAFKNRKRLQRDGGRAWIMDSQLQEARKGANWRLETIRKNLDKIRAAGERSDESKESAE